VQEWQEKSLALAHLPGAEFHLVGPLQSNKTARAVELFHAIDAVDSLKIATRLDAAARALGKRLPILIEVKLSHEESKHGVAPAELPTLLAALAPLEACPSLTQISMGMSNDFAVAIEEGSTCIRIGTALFGIRQYATGTLRSE
jgi:uncharacterized pyridoxal phosphate-containing UPF0001 family protein